MNAPASIPLPRVVFPGQTVEISVDLRSPALPGNYRGIWLLKNGQGLPVAVSTKLFAPVWVDIVVNTISPEEITFDMAANACLATWSNSKDILRCPGLDRDIAGYVQFIPTPMLETGTISPRAGLLTYPQNITDGYIQGIYPPIRVRNGDHFRTTVNCDYNASACLVLFQFDYLLNDGTGGTLWAIGEINEGKTYSPDIDLSHLAGPDIRFVLKVLAFGPAFEDRAIWVAPRIVHIQPTGQQKYSSPKAGDSPR